MMKKNIAFVILIVLIPWLNGLNNFDLSVFVSFATVLSYTHIINRSHRKVIYFQYILYYLIPYLVFGLLIDEYYKLLMVYTTYLFLYIYIDNISSKIKIKLYLIGIYALLISLGVLIINDLSLNIIFISFVFLYHLASILSRFIIRKNTNISKKS